MMHNLTKPDVR